MGTKFHIDINGKPAKCFAKTRNCPKEHFDNIKEAQAYIDEQFEKEMTRAYSVSRNISINDMETTYKNRNSFSNKILKTSGSNHKGWKEEIFMSENYARDKGLKYALVLNNRGTYNFVGSKRNELPEGFTRKDISEILKRANSATKEAYGDRVIVGSQNLKKLGRSLLENPVKVVYFDDNKKNIFIQNGGSNLLDAITVEDDSFRILELKKTSGSGAQMGQRTVSLGRDGSFYISDSNLSENVMNEVNRMNIYENDDKDQFDLKVSNDEALRQFVRDYKNDGADEFVFMDAYNRPVSIDLTHDEDLVIQEMHNRDLVATLKVRTNYRSVSMDDDSINRFLSNKNNLYSGNVDEDGNITLGQINKDKIKKTSSFVRFGEFKTKIKYNDLNNLPKDTKINIKDLTYFVPIMSGDIKLRTSRKINRAERR